jgi:hypothetical protein
LPQGGLEADLGEIPSVRDQERLQANDLALENSCGVIRARPRILEGTWRGARLNRADGLLNRHPRPPCPPVRASVETLTQATDLPSGQVEDEFECVVDRSALNVI